jgi:hypothetical protein
LNRKRSQRREEEDVEAKGCYRFVSSPPLLSARPLLISLLFLSSAGKGQKKKSKNKFKGNKRRKTGS